MTRPAISYLTAALLAGVPATSAAAESTISDSLQAAGRNLMTKEQRFYDLQLRNAELKVKRAELDKNDKESEYQEIRDLYDDNIRTLDLLNESLRRFQRAELAFKQAEIDLEEDRLRFLRDATHLTVLEAKKYRTPNGRRQVEIVMQNASNLNQALLLNPHKAPDEVRSLLEVQSIRVSIEMLLR